MKFVELYLCQENTWDVWLIAKSNKKVKWRLVNPWLILDFQVENFNTFKCWSFEEDEKQSTSKVKIYNKCLSEKVGKNLRLFSRLFSNFLKNLFSRLKFEKLIFDECQKDTESKKDEGSEIYMVPSVKDKKVKQSEITDLHLKIASWKSNIRNILLD